jgi:hypothetical protein
VRGLPVRAERSRATTEPIGLVPAGRQLDKQPGPRGERFRIDRIIVCKLSAAVAEILPFAERISRRLRAASTGVVYEKTTSRSDAI